MPSYFPEGDTPSVNDTRERAMAKAVSLLPAALAAWATPVVPPPDPEPEYNAVIVSGAGTVAANRTYVFISIEEGKPYYLAADVEIVWFEGQWYLFSATTLQSLYISGSDTYQPWDAEWVVAEGAAPVPTLTPTVV
jgi:hypothetical protein